MKLKCVLAVTGLLLTASCVTTTTFTREPAGENETLVIGRILFDCQLTRTGSIPIGKYTYNVKLEFEDVATGRVLKLRTVDPKGFFYLHNPQGNQLRLIRLAYSQGFAQPDIHKKSSTKQFLKETSRGASTSMTIRWPATYTLQRGKVNNLGRILWTGDMSSRRHEYTYNQEYDKTRTTFAERYPKSLWIQKQWVNIRGE